MRLSRSALTCVTFHLLFERLHYRNVLNSRMNALGTTPMFVQTGFRSDFQEGYKSAMPRKLAPSSHHFIKEMERARPARWRTSRFRRLFVRS